MGRSLSVTTREILPSGATPIHWQRRCAWPGSSAATPPSPKLGSMSPDIRPALTQIATSCARPPFVAVRVTSASKRAPGAAWSVNPPDSVPAGSVSEAALRPSGAPLRASSTGSSG
jgi:hypothetical protein